MTLQRCTLEALTLVDEDSFRHVGLYAALKNRLRKDHYEFRVPAIGAGRSWDDVLLLNLTYWTSTDSGDVLMDRFLPADTLCHVAWHHCTARAWPEAFRGRPRTDALFFSEALASAFDVYLVGRLIGHSPDAEFLQTQVPAMAEVANAAGLDEAGFEAMLEGLAAQPEEAFESLRALLFDAMNELSNAATVESADAVLQRLSARPFGVLLHHFALSNWVLYGRAYGDSAPDETIRAFDAKLRNAGSKSLELLETAWLSA